MDLKSAAYNPDQTEQLDNLVRKAFSEFVRKERRNLLVASSVSIFIAFGKVSTSEATALGLHFSSLTPKLIYASLVCVCLYSVLSFWFYALPEYRGAKKAWRSNWRISASNHTTDYIPWATHRDNLISRLRYLAWLTFEYVLPVLLGLTSIVFLSIRFLARA